MKFVVSYFLLACGVASASLERKRFAVNTDASRPSDAFGFSSPFGVEPDMRSLSVFDFLSASMSMSLSMSMSMSMSMDMGSFSGNEFMPGMPSSSTLVKAETGVSLESDSAALPPHHDNSFLGQAAANNAPAASEPVTPALEQQDTIQTMVADEKSRTCTSYIGAQMKEVKIDFAYELQTEHWMDVPTVKGMTDAMILDAFMNNYMSCDASRRLSKRQLAEFVLRGVGIDSTVTDSTLPHFYLFYHHPACFSFLTPFQNLSLHTHTIVSKRGMCPNNEWRVQHRA
mmetsp:Transcript_52873/g.78821  ORF Transcript_52873/g.78821 Transcript_52873/m.78821 type:complete len:285 (+) Transcript_52873:115-969(+)